MSSREAKLIDYIVDHTDLNQAELARRLNVSRAQISKWKAGDHISMERTSQLLKLAGLFDTVNVEWAMFAKTEKNALAWYDYIQGIQKEEAEIGYSLSDCIDCEPQIYVGQLILKLRDVGATFEQTAPATHWDDEEEGAFTPLATTVFPVLENWGQLKDWIAGTFHFEDVSDEASYELSDVVGDLEWLALDLTFEHLESEEFAATGIEEAKANALVKTSKQTIKSRLHDVCRIRTKHGLPITENYFQLLYLKPKILAEKCWFDSTYVAPNEENLIRAHLPYGQRLILDQLEHSAMSLNQLHEKLDRLAKSFGA